MSISVRLWFVFLLLLECATLQLVQRPSRAKAPVRSSTQGIKRETGQMKEPRIEDPDFDTSGLTAIEMPMTQSPAVAISKPAWDLPNVKYSGTVEVTLTIGADGRHTENFKSTGIAKLDAYLKSFLSRWRWSPGKIDAKPVMSKKKIHLIFAQ